MTPTEPVVASRCCVNASLADDRLRPADIHRRPPRHADEAVVRRLVRLGIPAR
jgi:hypothetical protein